MDMRPIGVVMVAYVKCISCYCHHIYLRCLFLRTLQAISPV